MLSTDQRSLNLEFALNEKQFACIQNVDVMEILPTGYGKTVIYTILPRVLNMLPYGDWCWSSEERLHMMGLGAVHLSGNTVTGKPLF